MINFDLSFKKYIFLLCLIPIYSTVFSQGRTVLVNTGATSRTVIVLDSASNTSNGDIWAQLEQERIALEEAEEERRAAEIAEQERLAAEKAEQERLAIENVKAEKERKAAEKAEQKRQAEEQAKVQKAQREIDRAVAKLKYQSYLRNSKIKTVLMAQASYSLVPQLSYGGMLGQMYKGVGWYVNARSNFNAYINDCYVSDMNGAIDGEMPFYKGTTWNAHFLATGGLMVNFLEWSAINKFNTFGMYVGGGYGMRELYLQTTHGEWVKYSPTSYRGVAGSVGLFGSALGFTLSAGLSTIAFKYVEFEVGIGYMF